MIGVAACSSIDGRPGSKAAADKSVESCESSADAIRGDDEAPAGGSLSAARLADLAAAARCPCSQAWTRRMVSASAAVEPAGTRWPRAGAFAAAVWIRECGSCGRSALVCTAALRSRVSCRMACGSSSLCAAVREASLVGFAIEGRAMQASAIIAMAAAFRRMLFLEVRRPQSNFKPSWNVDMQ